MCRYVLNGCAVIGITNVSCLVVSHFTSIISYWSKYICRALYGLVLCGISAFVKHVLIF